MIPGRHGMINYSTWPFTIDINKHDFNGRSYVSVIHELWHGGTRLHKWDLPEKRIHPLAIFTASKLRGVENFKILALGLNQFVNEDMDWKFDKQTILEMAMFVRDEIHPMVKKFSELIISRR